MNKITNKIKIALAVIFAVFFVVACAPSLPYTPEVEDNGQTQIRQSSGQTVSRATPGTHFVEITNEDTHIPNGGIIFTDYSPRTERPIFRLREPVDGIVVVDNRVWFDRNEATGGFLVAEGTPFTVVAQLKTAEYSKDFTAYAAEPTGFEFYWETRERAEIRNFDDIRLRVRPARHLVDFTLEEPIPGMFIETIQRSYARAVYATHVPPNAEFTVIARIDRDNGPPIYTRRTFLAVDGVGVEEGAEFYHNFSSGVEDLRRNWHIADGSWGGQYANGGVVPENISLTDDGFLAIAANGDYYDGNTRGFNRDIGIRTGGAIVSRNIFGPGIFEVKARFVPRVGACSAIWTFYFEGPSFNHEIDFESPGSHPNNSQHSLENILYSSWRGDESATGSFSTAYDTLPTPVNDGNFHIYRFEWRSYPAPSIRFYVNDQFRHEITDPNHIPCTAARFWIGVWFPTAAFCGEPIFERDYMLVDWVRHVPFDEPIAREGQTGGWSMGRHGAYADVPATVLGRFPTRTETNPLIDSEGIMRTSHNLVSNGMFISVNDYIPIDGRGHPTRPAWEFNSGSTGSTRIENRRSLRIANATPMAGGLANDRLELDGFANAMQSIDAVYEHFVLRFSARVRGTGNAALTIQFFDYNDLMLTGTGISNIPISLTANLERVYRLSTPAPAGTKRVRIILSTRANSTAYFEDVQLRLAEPLEIPPLASRPGPQIVPRP